MRTNVKVTFAQMHQSGFIPGLDRTLKKSELSTKTWNGLEMSLCVAGVYCEFEGRGFVIPYVNFQSIVLEKQLPVSKRTNDEKTT